MVTVIRISKRTMRIVHENKVFALGVKAIIIVLAAAGVVGMYAAIFGDVGVLYSVTECYEMPEVQGNGP